MKCVCTLAGSAHYPWCDYFPGGALLAHPDGSSWEMWDNPIRIGERILIDREAQETQEDSSP